MARTPTIRTIVRFLRLTGLRLGFRLGAFLAPAATIRRAGALFCTPLPGSRRVVEVPPNASEGDLEVAGQRIHTYAWGDPHRQPYVLFAHGWSDQGARFAPWVARLRAEGYAVVAFDQAAHGRSSGERTTLPGFTETLLAVGRRFGPAAAVVGHSLGGAATAVALAQGLQAQRVVLIAPAADPVAAAQRFARLIALPERLCRRMIAGFEARIGLPFAHFQAHFNAPRIAQPALVVHDLEDREVPWSEGERYARFLRRARLLTTRGLGHNRIADDAGVIAAVLRFLHGAPVGERVVSTPDLPFGIA